MSELPVDPDEAKREAINVREQYGRVSTDSATYANSVMPSLRAAAGYVGAMGGSLGMSAHPPEDCDAAATRDLLNELVDVYLTGDIEA